MLWRCSSKIKSHFFGLPLPSSNVMTLSVMTFAMHHESPCRFARRQPTCFESLGGSRTRHYPTRRLENFLHMQATISRQRQAGARERVTIRAARRSRLRAGAPYEGAHQKTLGIGARRSPYGRGMISYPHQLSVMSALQALPRFGGHPATEKEGTIRTAVVDLS